MSASTQFAAIKSPEHYEALLRATATIAGFRDCESFEKLFAGELRRVVSFDYLNFVIFDETDCTVEWRLFESSVAGGATPVDEFPGDDTTSAWAYERQQPIVISDWDSETRFQGTRRILRQLGISSTCTLPLTTVHRRFGVIEVGSSRPNAYPEEEISLLSLVANHVTFDYRSGAQLRGGPTRASRPSKWKRETQAAS